jgi:hypothetical protein
MHYTLKLLKPAQIIIEYPGLLALADEWANAQSNADVLSTYNRAGRLTTYLNAVGVQAATAEPKQWCEQSLRYWLLIKGHVKTIERLRLLTSTTIIS